MGKYKFTKIAAGLLLINGCSMFNKTPDALPIPPQSLHESGPIMLPQLGNSARPVISESAAAANNRNESGINQRKYIENRGPGGAVNKITVDNPHAPDYTLTPNQEPNNSTNNNPDKLTTPSWGYSW